MWHIAHTIPAVTFGKCHNFVQQAEIRKKVPYNSEDFRLISNNNEFLSFRIHYANTPMQYTAIFHCCKNVNFQMIFFNIFLFFAQNIDCGYTLEPPQ